MVRSTPDWAFKNNPKIKHQTIMGYGDQQNPDKQMTKEQMRAETQRLVEHYNARRNKTV